MGSKLFLLPGEPQTVAMKQVDYSTCLRGGAGLCLHCSALVARSHALDSAAGSLPLGLQAVCLMLF